MAEQWRGLANRLREALESERDADARAARAAEDARHEEARARAALLDELAAFAEAVGHFDVTRDSKRIRLTVPEGWFEIDTEPEEVAVRFDGSKTYRPRLIRDRKRAEKPWMVCLTVDEEPHWLPLFEPGLEALINVVLDLDVPEDPETLTAVLFTRGTGNQERLVMLDKKTP